MKHSELEGDGPIAQIRVAFNNFLEVYFDPIDRWILRKYSDPRFIFFNFFVFGAALFIVIVRYDAALKFMVGVINELRNPSIDYLFFNDSFNTSGVS